MQYKSKMLCSVVILAAALWIHLSWLLMLQHVMI